MLNVTTTGGGIVPQRLEERTRVWSTFLKLVDIWPRQATTTDANSRHVRAIPWPSGRWRARRRIDTGHAGRLHSLERARGHVQSRCRGGGRVGRGEGCRRRHRSGGGPPASRDIHGRGRHSARQRSNHATRWRQKPPTSRRNKSWRAGTIARGSSWARRTPDVAARGFWEQHGAMGGGRGAGAVQAL